MGRIDLYDKIFENSFGNSLYTSYFDWKLCVLLLTSQDFPTQRHHKLFDSVEFLLLLAF